MMCAVGEPVESDREVFLGMVGVFGMFDLHVFKWVGYMIGVIKT